MAEILSSLEFFNEISAINDPERAHELLRQTAGIQQKIEDALAYATKAHEGQFRKGGGPYVTHPILVACIVAHYGGDEAMICAALLHDVVEDTVATREDVASLFGEDVASLVDSLTKIVEIREEELPPASSNRKMITAALTFRKMLIASVRDIRALVIKLCDRFHNMLTLQALAPNKRVRISEETLVVYAPIAHRLGISSIKNELEDLSFRYIFPEEYEKIDLYFQDNHQELQLKLNTFLGKVKRLLISNGIPEGHFQLMGRIKRRYSTYLKMQRKGISIEEVLDLLALRIIVQEPLDCYRVLGIVHLKFKPILSRFKDYVALPKENGYQTIHTTIFDDSLIYEVQIRTEDMHKGAEYGVAAHWKYKAGGAKTPSLGWLNDLQFQNNTIEEFYELAKNDLYREDIVVFSPDGDTYTLPVGAVVLDFAYAVHTDIGNHAKKAMVNNQQVSLLTVLKSGDIVKIITVDKPIVRPSWGDAVKTSKAKHQIRITTAARYKEVERLSAFNIIATIFGKTPQEIADFVNTAKLESSIHRACTDLIYLKELESRIENSIKKDANLFMLLKIKILKLKEYVFDSFLICSNYNISETLFDYCCHPKFGDEVIALKSGSKAFIHHKLCERALGEIERGAKMLYVSWIEDAMQRFVVIVALENQKGILANFLQFLAKNDMNVLSIDVGGRKNSYSAHSEIHIECHDTDVKTLKKLLSQKFRIIDVYSLKDAYSNG
ncbi:penta-phosphate guanosine-3'-pyrophosphohydrolase [Helicobacter monodelphidis]|uniref:RelA/SpoT family protein n=1 Tax=Helicobacter sp. 15-1451 TaxID=2004995 RepID=UPI000DCE9293|nr:RelA/SpoT family protein [Helicobacter sp. 15-1451]RAX58604.1 penta-phosphate guanosine-3'-pyrophosphohydrolase [Helicobacter sp. 15-1451]